MRVFEALGVVLWAWSGVIRLAGDLRLWSPLLLFTLLRLLGLILLVFFHDPRLVAVGGPVVRVLGGEAALHYPAHLYLLPELFRRLDAVWILVVGALGAGMVTLRFARAFGSAEIAPDPRGALQKLPALLGLAASGVAVTWAVPALIGLLPEEIRLGGMMIRLALMILQWGAFVFLMARLMYSIAAIVVGGRSLVGGIAESHHLSKRKPVVSLALAAVPMGVLFPLFVLGEIDLADRGVPPEGMVILVFGRILVELFFWFLLLGSASRVYVWLKDGRQ